MWEKRDSGRNLGPEEPVVRPPVPPGTGKVVNLGQSIVVQGELSGSEDLTIDGQVQGKISLRDHNLTIGSHGKIKAEVFAKTVTILGHVQGNVTAGERVDIQTGGRLEGDIVAPRVAISDGAHFRGRVEMEKGGGQRPVAGRERVAEAAQGTSGPRGTTG